MVSIILALKGVVNELEAGGGPVTPISLLYALFGTFPQFNERAEEGGGYRQQVSTVPLEHDFEVVRLTFIREFMYVSCKEFRH